MKTEAWIGAQIKLSTFDFRLHITLSFSTWHIHPLTFIKYGVCAPIAAYLLLLSGKIGQICNNRSNVSFVFKIQEQTCQVKKREDIHAIRVQNRGTQAIIKKRYMTNVSARKILSIRNFYLFRLHKFIRSIWWLHIKYGDTQNFRKLFRR
jgi:hypothetical protein